MIIHLTHSDLFKIEPAIRFGRENAVKKTVFQDLWRRYRLDDYDMHELCAFFLYKTDKRMRPDSMQRWIWCMEVYLRAAPLVKKGVRVVPSEFFEDLEEELIKELTRNMFRSRKYKSRSIL